MQLILDNGDTINSRFSLGEVVALVVQTESVGVVVAITVQAGGTLTYGVSFAGNLMEIHEAELVETVAVDATEEDSDE